MTKEFSKTQKAVILFWVFYELIVAVNVSKRDWIAEFLACSIPCILYWSGVWIWGFGYISNLFGRLKIKKWVRMEKKTKKVKPRKGGFGRLAYLGGLVGAGIIASISGLILKETESLFLTTLILSISFYIVMRIMQERCYDIGTSPTAFMIPYAFVSFMANVYGRDVMLQFKNPLSPIYVFCCILVLINNFILLVRRGSDSKKRARQDKKVAMVMTGAYLILMNIVVTILLSR